MTFAVCSFQPIKHIKISVLSERNKIWQERLYIVPCTIGKHGQVSNQQCIVVFLQEEEE